MIKVWTVCLIAALVFIISVPIILSGKGDKLIISDEVSHFYVIKRLRILMAALSSFAAVFCIIIPFIMIGTFRIDILWITAVFSILVIAIIIMTKTWAKK